MNHLTEKTLAQVVVAQAEIDTPLGPMTAATTERGLCGLWFGEQKHRPAPLTAKTHARHPHVLAVQAWLHEFWQRGDSQVAVPLDPQGTPFQQKVWLAIRAIPSGSTVTYGSIASQLGTPNASRAVGAATGRNPLGLIVPCHRVMGQNGSMTGYAGGLPRKEKLLAWEASHAKSEASHASPEASHTAPEASTSTALHGLSPQARLI
jgi:methylated-DNA-[protein]-cysteine S-methyltransferase